MYTFSDGQPDNKGQVDVIEGETQTFGVIEINADNISNLLCQNGIDLALWNGENGTKTITDLLKEISDGESDLVDLPSGERLRVCHVIAADVYHRRSDGVLLRLKEDRQVFKEDGKIKRRPHLQGAVAEKMKVGEDIAESVIRGLNEELSINGDYILGEEVVIIEDRVTPTYPGLGSRYVIHKVPVLLGATSFNPDGYIEEQEKKTNYFVWEEAEE